MGVGTGLMKLLRAPEPFQAPVMRRTRFNDLTAPKKVKRE